MNSFFLCLVSPVLHKTLCGIFKEAADKVLDLEGVDQGAFVKTFALACGRHDHEQLNLDEIIELGKIADRFQISFVLASLEKAVMNGMDMKDCGRVLGAGQASGLTRLEEACCHAALSQFEVVARSGGFLQMSESTLGSLLEDDGLVAENEERVFEILVEWMKGTGHDLRGEELLRKIRFPLMDGTYLATKVGMSIPENELLQDLVRQAALVKCAAPEYRAEVPLSQLRANTLVPRRSKKEAWKRLTKDDVDCLSSDDNKVLHLAEYNSKFCCALSINMIRVWDISTLEECDYLKVKIFNTVTSFKSFNGLLVCGLKCGNIKVLVLGGKGDYRELEGHDDEVSALSSLGDLLISGSADSTIKIWSVGTGVEWACDRTMIGHVGGISCLVVWGARVVSGGKDASIRVWDVGSGRLESVLRDHSDGVTVISMAVHLNHIFSCSTDETIRVWMTGTWSLLWKVKIHPEGSELTFQTLVVCGSKLITVSDDQDDEDMLLELKVWNLDGRPACKETLYQNVSDSVSGLTAVGDELWGSIGSEIMFWGPA